MSSNRYSVSVRKYRADALSIGTTVKEAYATSDSTRDYGTLAYFIAGRALGFLTYDAETGRLARGAGSSWAEAAGVGDTEKGEYAPIVARRRGTLAAKAIADYEARLAADGVTVAWASADDESVHEAIRAILALGSLESQYKGEGSKKEDSLARIVADAMRRCAAIGERYESLVAAIEAEVAASGLEG